MTLVSASAARRPFKSLDPYTRADHDIFFGRDREADELYRLFFDRPVTLVYGQSGSGKTSLIQCGLFSQVDAAELAVIPVRTAVQPLSAFRTVLRRNSGETSDDLVVLARSAARQSSKTLALFFDQFEEMFLLHDDRTRNEFAGELRRLIDARLDLRIIAAAREEYLGRISEIETVVPELMAGRYRVARMSRLQAQEAIGRACRTCNVGLQPGTLSTVFDDLAGGPGDPIELPLVQVVMDHLYQKAIEESASDPVLTATALEAAGGTRNVLGRFLEHQVEGTPDKDLAKAILKLMVTAEGTKRLVAARAVAAQLQGVPPGAVAPVMQHLVTARVLRMLESTGEEWFELRHDALAAEVDRWLSSAERELIALRTIIESRYQHYAARGILLDANTLREIEPFEDALSALPEHRNFIHLSRAEQERQTLFNEVNQAVMMAYLSAADGQESLFLHIVRRAFAIQDSRDPDYSELFNTLREFIRLRERAHATHAADANPTIAGEPDLSTGLARIFATSHADLVGHVSNHILSLLVFPDATFLTRWLRLLVHRHIPPALTHLGRADDPVLSSAAEVLGAIAAMERGQADEARQRWAAADIDKQPFARDLDPPRLLERFRQMTGRYITGEDRRLRRDEALMLVRRIACVIRLGAATGAASSADVEGVLHELYEKELLTEAAAVLDEMGDLLGKKTIGYRLRILGRIGEPQAVAAGRALLDSVSDSEEEGEACYRFGLALQRAHQHADAIVCHERAIALGHEVADAHRALGWAFECLGDTAAATRHYTEAFRSSGAVKHLIWAARQAAVAGPGEHLRFLLSIEDEFGTTAGWRIATALQYAFTDMTVEAHALLTTVDLTTLSASDIQYVVDTYLACDALTEVELALRAPHADAATLSRYCLAVMRWDVETMKKEMRTLHRTLPAYAYYYLLEYLHVGSDDHDGLNDSTSAWRQAVAKNVALEGPESGFGEHLLAYLLGRRTLQQIEAEAASAENPQEAWCELHFYVGIREWKEGKSPRERFEKTVVTDVRRFTEHQLARAFLRRLEDNFALPPVTVPDTAAPARFANARSSLREGLRDELVGLVREGTIGGDYAKKLAERSVDFLQGAVTLSDLRRGISLLASKEWKLRIVESRFFREFGSPHLVLERLVGGALTRDDWPLARRLLAESDSFSGDVHALLAAVPELPADDQALANSLLTSDL
jgi:tetratricopeptide (TPR) repeat protein